MIVAVAGGKGGVGKSTVAYNLGATLDGRVAEEGGRGAACRRAVVVDADLGMADLPAGRGPDLHDVLAGRATPLEAIRGRPVPLLPCGRSLAGARAADVRRLEEAIGAVAEEFGVVVLDCPAGLRADVGVPLAIADACLLVTAPRRFALADAVRTRELARELDAGLVGAVLNRVVESPPVGSVERTLEAPVTVLPADPRLGRSVSEAAPVVRTHPNSDPAAALEDLATAVHSSRSV